MTADLGTSEAGVQISLTAFLIGAGIGRVIFGPQSDRFGRPPLFIGLSISILASAGSALTPTAGTLAAALLIQGIAAASGTAPAFLGLLQFLLAGAVAPLVSLAGSTSALPLGITMLAASAIANLAFLGARNAASPHVQHASRADA